MTYFGRKISSGKKNAKNETFPKGAPSQRVALGMLRPYFRGQQHTLLTGRKSQNQFNKEFIEKHCFDTRL